MKGAATQPYSSVELLVVAVGSTLLNTGREGLVVVDNGQACLIMVNHG